MTHELEENENITHTHTSMQENYNVSKTNTAKITIIYITIIPRRIRTNEEIEK